MHLFDTNFLLFFYKKDPFNGQLFRFLFSMTVALHLLPNFDECTIYTRSTVRRPCYYTQPHIYIIFEWSLCGHFHHRIFVTNAILTTRCKLI